VAGVGAYYAGTLAAPVKEVVKEVTKTVTTTTTLAPGAPVTTTVTATAPPTTITKTVERTITTTATITSPSTIPLGPIKVGVVGELTGPWAYSGSGHVEGLRFAVDEINEGGGILGNRIELSVADSKSDVNEAITLFKRFVEVEKASVVIGGLASSVAIALVEEAEKAKVPLIVSWAASEKVHEKRPNYVFRSPVQLTPLLCKESPSI